MADYTKDWSDGDRTKMLEMITEAGTVAEDTGEPVVIGTQGGELAERYELTRQKLIDAGAILFGTRPGFKERVAFEESKDRLLSSVLAYMSAERDDSSGAYYDAQLGLQNDLLLAAARKLVRATDALPVDERPVGWDE